MTINKTYAWVLTIGGIVGIITSFLLTWDKIILLENPETVLPCNLNPLISCGSVLNSWQGAAFGVPNPMLGLIGFSFVFATGILMLFGASPSRKFWKLFLIGLVLAEIFIHWLIYQSIYVIGNLCLYCMVTWAATWPIFIFTISNLYPNSIVSKNRIAFWVGWYLLILLLILSHFRDFFFK